jgi:hypothetical protein
VSTYEPWVIGLRNSKTYLQRLWLNWCFTISMQMKLFYWDEKYKLYT